MSTLLPGGFVDTGRVYSYALAADISFIYGRGFAEYVHVARDQVSINQWTIIDAISTGANSLSCPPLTGSHNANQVNGLLWLSGPDLPPPSGMDPYYTEAGNSSCGGYTIGGPGEAPGWVYTASFTETAGPYRLGERKNSGSGNPVFAQGEQLEYAWFADEATTLITTLGGHTSTQAVAAGGPVNVGQTVGSLNIGGFIPSGYDTEESHAVFCTISNITYDLVNADFTGYTDAKDILRPSGNTIEVNRPAGDPGGSSLFIAKPWKWLELLRVTKDGKDSAGADIQPYHVPGGVIRGDGAIQRTFPNNSWYAPYDTQPISFAIDSTWAASQMPALPSDDLAIPIMGCPALLNPSADSGDSAGATVGASLPCTVSMGSLTGSGMATLVASLSVAVAVDGAVSGSVSAGVSGTFSGDISGSFSVSATGPVSGTGGSASATLTGTGSATMAGTHSSSDLMDFAVSVNAVLPIQNASAGQMQGTIQVSGGISGGNATVNATFDVEGAIGVSGVSGGCSGTSTVSSDSASISGSLSGEIGGGIKRVQHWYAPITITAPITVSCNRPDGNQPSVWVASGAVTVDDSGATSVFTVAGSGASVLRTLLTNWHNYIDLSNTGDPYYTFTNPDMATVGIDGYEIVRHNLKDLDILVHQTVYPEDLWWYAGYGWGFMDIDSPADGTLTLTLTHTHLSVSDSHTAGSDRLLSLEITQNVQTPAVYSIPVLAGRHTYYFDLLFPASPDGPVYLGRITSVKLEGFSTGTYTLHDWGLAAGVDGRDSSAPPLDGHWKHSFSIPRHRLTADALAALADAHLPIPPNPKFNAAVLSLDGSWTFQGIPDTTNKDDEVSAIGGSPRYVEVATSPTTGIILDSQYALAGYVAHLQRSSDGINIAYDQAAEDTANKDTFGNSLGGTLAQWICDNSGLPYKPLGLSSDATQYLFQPQCRPVVGSVKIVSGINFLIHAEKAIGAGIESLISDGAGHRASLGSGMELDDSMGAAVLTESTDQDGYVVFEPLGADEAVQYHLRGGSAGLKLRPRSLQRLDGVYPQPDESPIDGISVIPIDQTGRGYAYYSKGGSILEVTLTWSGTGPISISDSMPVTVASGSAPSAFRESDGDRQRGRGIRHLYYMRDGNTYSRVNLGGTWGSEMLELTGYTNTAAAYQWWANRVLLASVKTADGHLYIIPAPASGVSSSAFTPDAGSEVDLGAADAATPALTIYPTGAGEVRWVARGSVQKKTTVDGGASWS